MLGGIPKDTSIRFLREPSQPYLFIAFFTIIMIANSPTSPSQVSQSKAPPHPFVLHDKSLKDLLDIDQRGIILPPLKNRDAVI